MERLKGTSVYEGIVIGKAYLAKKKKEAVKVYKLSSDMVDDEIKRFYEALADTKQELKSLTDSLAGKVDQNDIKILNVHLMMLEDPVFISDITNKIRLEMVNAEKVVEVVVDKYSGMFKSLDDPVYRQRAIDIEDVGEKVLLNLQGKKLTKEDVHDKILVSIDLKPSELLRYHNEGIKILGIVTEMGGETSHVAILAKTLGIPTLMGVKNITKIDWENVGDVIMDTRKEMQEVVVNPTKTVLIWYTKEFRDFEMEKKELQHLIGIPAITKCQKRVFLHANIGGLADLESVKMYKPDGIGLLRTEFLYMESSYFPTETEQFKAYRTVAETIGKDKPVIIRTLDIGADKKLSYFEMPMEENPALGLRAIRLCMAHKNIFKTQLRAILRASAFGNIKMMYPMISGVEEIDESNKLLEEAKKELREENLPFNENIEVGVMIEVPSAGLIADILIQKADFFSIGTNDLTQYILAADRLSKEVAYVFNNYHPAVMRMIATIADAARKYGKKVSICGEMGGDTLALLAFLSFGIEDLSMLPHFIPKLKKIIKNIDCDTLKGLREKLLTASTSDEIKRTLNDYLLGVM